MEKEKTADEKFKRPATDERNKGAKQIIQEVQNNLSGLQELGYQIVFEVDERVDTSIELHEIGLKIKAVALNKNKVTASEDGAGELQKARVPLSDVGGLRSDYPAGM